MSRRIGGFVLSVAALVAVGWWFMGQPWNGSAQPPADKPRKDEFATDRGPGAAPPFRGDKAMEYLREICKIGPRVSGSEGMTRQRELIRKHFEALGATVREQKFTARQHSKPAPVEMVNLVVTWHPERLRRVILCSHYDTRPIADQEVDPRRWNQPFLSANDGGSGVALLMEMANHLKELPTAVGVDFVFFDGEEYVFNPRTDKYFFGSEYFAADYRRNKPRHTYLAGVLFDMVAGVDSRFPVEMNSAVRAGPLARQLWAIAAEVGATSFPDELGPEVLDDHIALNDARIPTVDIIDFKYPHWHRLSDTPDNCSGETMAEVARVVATWLQRMK